MPQSESAAKAGVPAQPESVSQRRDVVCFVVRRGRTRFPQRPLTGERFLIGSGSNCQLQLGGGEIPMLHSVVVRDDEGLWIEALVPNPPLSINGVRTRAGRLGVGDVIGIGPFEFGLQMASIVDEAPEGDGERSSAEKAPGEMTASELVDAIGREMTEVESWSQDRKAGAEALLAAAGGRTADRPVAIPVSEPVSDPVVATPDAASSGDLARRAAALNQLADLLQSLSEQLRHLDEPEDDHGLRVSA